MTSTQGEQHKPLVSYRPNYYQRVQNQIINAPFVDLSNKWAGGGLTSTCQDLVSFGNGLLDLKLLQPKTTSLLWENQQVKDGSFINYGLGWELKESEALNLDYVKSKRIISHAGGTCGATTQLLLFPEDRLVVAFMTNLEKAPKTFDLSANLADAVLKSKHNRSGKANVNR